MTRPIQKRRSPPLMFRPGDSIAEDISSRTRPVDGSYMPATAKAQSISAVAKRDLGRYYVVMKDEMATLAKQLSTNEACAVMDALNGTMLDESTYRFIWAEVADDIRLNGADLKWEIDGQTLVEKLRALTPAQSQALADAAERFWIHTDMGTDEALRFVGLLNDKDSE